MFAPVLQLMIPRPGERLHSGVLTAMGGAVMFRFLLSNNKNTLILTLLHQLLFVIRVW